MRFRFGDCLVDDDRFELRRGGERVAVQPKVLRLILFLLENRARTVSKDEILDAVWRDTATSEGSLTRAVSFARAALGEGQTDASIIRTVRGRGYAFGVPVSLEEAQEERAERLPSSACLCRDQELGLARDTLHHALSGAGQVLLIVGEPGIGKTRLAEEVVSLAEARGARAWWGRCREEEGAPSFWPWVQILRACLAECGAEGVASSLGDRAGELREVLPELRERLPDLIVPDRTDARRARFRLFEAVTALLRDASAKQPLVLVLDDLQSADSASLALLRFLAPELRSSPALVVATYRDAEVLPGDSLEGTLAELVRSQRPRRTIFLRGLTERCVRRFTEQFARITPSDDLVAALHRRTEGNPLFLIELLHWLASRDQPFDERASWDVRDARLPEGVRYVIGRRLDALSPECLAILELAAVVGRDFSVGVLAPICGRSHEEVLEQLGEAARRRIVEPVRDLTGRFWFTHGLIAEALREQLGIAARTRAHRRTAEILEQLYTPGGVSEGGNASRIPESHFAELAYHFGEAAITGSAGKAFDYTTRAGRHAMDVLAFEEAVKHYERALRLLEVDGEVHSAKRAPALVALGLAQQRAGEHASSEGSLRLAIESARECRDFETLAHAALQWNELAEGAPVRSETRERALDEALSGLTGDVDELRERVARALARERA